MLEELIKLMKLFEFPVWTLKDSRGGDKRGSFMDTDFPRSIEILTTLYSTLEDGKEYVFEFKKNPKDPASNVKRFFKGEVQNVPTFQSPVTNHQSYGGFNPPNFEKMLQDAYSNGRKDEQDKNVMERVLEKLKSIEERLNDQDDSNDKGAKMDLDKIMDYVPKISKTIMSLSEMRKGNLTT